MTDLLQLHRISKEEWDKLIDAADLARLIDKPDKDVLSNEGTTMTREELEGMTHQDWLKSHPVRSREEVEGTACSSYTVEPAKHVCKCKKPYIKVTSKRTGSEYYIMKSNIIGIGRESPHNLVVIDLANEPADYDSWIVVTDTLESILEQL